MSNPNKLTANDIPFLLQQLEHQSHALAKAEATITLLKESSTEGKTTATQGAGDTNQDIKTLTERLALTQEGLIFFFQEFARLKRLLITRDVNDPEDALIRAAEQGRLHVVTLLLEAHADVNVRDQTQGTALIAASYNGHIKVVEELLKYKADTDLQDEGGHTALIFSADKGHMEICTLLLKAGAAVNKQDKRGNSALTMASYIGHIDICHLLVQYKGVDVDIKNDDGRTPLMMSCYPPELETRYLNAKTDICELLIDVGADVNAVNKSDNTALHIASKYGHYEECEMLLSEGADATIRNKDNKLPEDVAGNPDTKALLQHKHSIQRDAAAFSNMEHPRPSHVGPSVPASENANPQKSSMKKKIRSSVKNVFALGRGLRNSKDDEEEAHVSAVHQLYGTSERVSDRMHSIGAETGDPSQRRRYAFVHENSMAKRIESAMMSSAEKKKSRLSINKLQSNSSQTSQNSQSQPRKSVGEFNATKRISLEERPSLGSIDVSRDSMTEARERRRRRSSGAEETNRQLEELRRRHQQEQSNR